MTDEIGITIQNKLVTEKRSINVYRHFTRDAYLISYNSSVDLHLGTDIGNDYLHISIVSGPGPLADGCVVNLPAWADYEFSSEGKLTAAHDGDRKLLKIPPGPCVWQLKITRSPGMAGCPSSECIIKIGDHVSGWH